MTFRKTVLPVFLAAVWIGVSEFARGQFLLKSYWTDHYAKLGLVFPMKPVNGIVWGVWSLMFAIAVYVISRKFNLVQTFLLAWFVGFALMYVVLGNMGVLPQGILVFAVPLSLLEAFLAALIVKKLS